MHRSYSPEYQPLVQHAQKSLAEVRGVRSRLRTDYPHWAWDDARLTTFVKLANVFRAMELSLIFIDQHLSNAEWWIRLRGEDTSISRIKLEYVAYSQCSKTGLLHLGFGAVESGFRLFLRALDSDACKGGTAEFKSIYECLLTTKLGRGRHDYPLLDLLRLTRNTVHNEGVYFHKSAQDVTVSYKGVDYAFQHGQPIEFANWALIQMLLDDLGALIESVVRHPLLVEFAEAIQDPGAIAARKLA